MAAWIGAVAQILIAFSLVIMWRQAKVAKDQIDITKQIHRSESLYETFRFLSEIRDQIEWVLELEHKEFSRWNDNDKRSALVVCNRFNSVGVLIEEGIVPIPPIAKSYFYSIPKCYCVLEKHSIELRDSRSAGYWKSFEFLRDEVVKYNKKNHNGLYLVEIDTIRKI